MLMTGRDGEEKDLKFPKAFRLLLLLAVCLDRNYNVIILFVILIEGSKYEHSNKI